MTSLRSPLRLFFVLLITTIALTGLLGVSDAFAQQKSAGFAATQQNIGSQIVQIPKLVAIIAYVIGTFFAATGVIKLRDWMSEPDKNPINGAIFRLVVASLLICLPKILYMTNATMFGSKGDYAQSNDQNVSVKSLNAFGTGKQP